MQLILGPKHSSFPFSTLHSKFPLLPTITLLDLANLLGGVTQDFLSERSEPLVLFFEDRIAANVHLELQWASVPVGFQVGHVGSHCSETSLLLLLILANYWTIQ